MLPNMLFDLVSAIQNKSEALAIYDTYAKDAQSHSCPDCANLWKQMKQRDEEDLARLTAELEKHVRAGELTKGMPRTTIR